MEIKGSSIDVAFEKVLVVGSAGMISVYPWTRPLETSACPK